jgi:hypothetical protein
MDGESFGRDLRGGLIFLGVLILLVGLVLGGLLAFLVWGL